MNLCAARVGGSHVLYDRDAVVEPSESLFDPGHWRRQGAVVGQGEGRGEAVFIRAGNDTWVLRHYRRGGWAARLFGDRYVNFTFENSRPWRELRLTAELYARGLPVPAPVAARVYGPRPLRRGDLITRLIAETMTLASHLAKQALPPPQWAALGHMLRRFHDAGLLHHDINARNVLIDRAGRFYLIDLDKARLAAPGAWRERTRLRLLRSLRKFAAREPQFHFADADWQTLTEAYRGT
jgi:3-deoxy-D-manno-octulosonic acid kinase